MFSFAKITSMVWVLQLADPHPTLLITLAAMLSPVSGYVSSSSISLKLIKYLDILMNNTIELYGFGCR